MNMNNSTTENGRPAHRALCYAALLIGLWLPSGVASAEETAPAANTLQDISYTSLPGDRVEIKLTLSGPPAQPISFTIDNPARIALDFPNTTLGLAQKTQQIGVGIARSINAVEAKGRSRVVLNLVQLAPYETRIEGNSVYLTLGGSAGGEAPATAVAQTAPAAPAAVAAPAQASAPAGRGLENIDFRRGDKGEGRVVVTLTDPATGVDIREQGGKILVDFANSSLPETLERRLDVTDFATPVKTVETSARGKNVHMEITPSGEYDHLAYQAGNLYTIEVKPLTKAEQEAAKKEKLGYTGEKLSLNFQSIDVRAVLQLIADFTGLNMVVSDSVQGNVTLRLKNVPWDQALDIILKSRGLGMRQIGNVIQVAPTEEIAAREKLDLESQKQVAELAPLRSEFIRVNFAKASDLAALLKSKENSLLSARGNVTIDDRTNTLLVQDTADKLIEVRKLVTTLDIPQRQVLIESRIVIANNDFGKDLGVRFGATGVRENGNDGILTTTGTLAGTNNTVASAVENIRNSGQPFPVLVPSDPTSNIPRIIPVLPNPDNRLNVNLPVSASTGKIAFSILASNILLDLELSAMQKENRGEVLSNPRVVTSNQKEATIEQGVEIPYLTASSSGAVTITFRKAVLELKVKPQITPDDHVIMDLSLKKDTVGQTIQLFGSLVPSIDTREVVTQVLVDNGETVVLGGVYEQTNSKQVERVPLLGDLPGVGALFRRTQDVDNKRELLMFVTPKILKDSLTVTN